MSDASGKIFKYFRKSSGGIAYVLYDTACYMNK